MVDLETLGSGTDAAIASIGAVVIDDETKEIISEFEINVNIESCTDAGLKIDALTVIWWLTQSREAISETFLQPAGTLEYSLNALGDFIAETGCERFWSHGATFDIPILNNACKAIKREQIIPYHFARDTRTIYELADVSPKNFFPIGTTAHRAIDDARAQAQALIVSWDKLKEPVGQTEWKALITK